MKTVLLAGLLAAGFFVPRAAAAAPGSAAASALPAAEPAPARTRVCLDQGWRFHLGNAADQKLDFGFGDESIFAKTGEPSGPAAPKFDDSAWPVINLPHDWVVGLPFVDDPGANRHYVSRGSKPVGRVFPQNSIGWYRRSLDIPAGAAGRRFVLDFDGVYRNCMVWVNGCYVGRNLDGYNPFFFDITNYLNYGGKNVLVVRVDATEGEGWFYEGAGIYRHVWLTETAPLHVAHWGTFVQSEVSGDSAALTVQTKVRNDADTGAQFTVVSTVVPDDAPDDAAVAAHGEPAQLAAHAAAEFTDRLTVPHPQLWDLDAPHLYTLITQIRQDGRTVDEYRTTFGIRTLRFDPDRGVFLNGRRVEIQGMCVHQDAAGVGSAVPDHLLFWRLEQLKKMGANAYRTSHNAPAAELAADCDRLGILIMDENRRADSDPEALTELRNLVLRDRNHPSVFLWSLGNEEWVLQYSPIGARIGATMKRLVHELDPSRPVTIASNGGPSFEGINTIVDVHGINYVRGHDFDTFHREHPAQPIIGSEEASAIGTRGVYAKDPARGWMDDYGTTAVKWGLTPEEWWKYYCARPWLEGAFVWTGFDYRGEPTPYGWPCISSHFGVMDTCGFPKNSYYYYQSQWLSQPVLHLFPHWNWPGREGQPIGVYCYSNCASVELFLNGRSLGRQDMPPRGHLEWKVDYAPGTLLARGYDAQGRETATDRVETTGAPAGLQLTPDRTAMRADGADVTVVNVAVVDAQGRVVPTADNLVKFTVSDNGRVLGVGNGDPSCHEPDQASQRSAFNGYCQVIVQSGHTPGTLRLEASADGLRPATVEIQLAPAPAP